MELAVPVLPLALAQERGAARTGQLRVWQRNRAPASARPQRHATTRAQGSPWQSASPLLTPCLTRAPCSWANAPRWEGRQLRVWQRNRRTAASARPQRHHATTGARQSLEIRFSSANPLPYARPVLLGERPSLGRAAAAGLAAESGCCE
jgi:hypothetical protein